MSWDHPQNSTPGNQFRGFQSHKDLTSINWTTEEARSIISTNKSLQDHRCTLKADYTLCHISEAEVLAYGTGKMNVCYLAFMEGETVKILWECVKGSIKSFSLHFFTKEFILDNEICLELKAQAMLCFSRFSRMGKKIKKSLSDRQIILGCGCR